MKDRVWLGRLVVANNFYCQFEPLAEASDGKWVEIEAKNHLFPRHGYVRADKSDVGAQRALGGLWVFECRPSGLDSDQWRADKPARAQLVVDLSELSLAEARRLLLETGIALPDHQSRNATVLLKDDTYCVFRFIPRGHLWVARSPERAIELRRASATWKDSITASGALFLPMKEDPQGEIVQRLDWSTQSEFLAKVVKSYQAAVSGYLTLNGRGADAPARKLDRALAEGKLRGKEAEDFEALVERMRLDWPEISQKLQAVEGMTELLLGSEPGKRLLDEAVARKTRDLEVDIEGRLRKDVEERLASQRAVLESARKSIDAAEAKRAELKTALAVLERQGEHLATDRLKTDADLRTARAALKTASEQFSALETRRSSAVSELEKASSEHAALLRGIATLKAALTDFADRVRREMEASGEDDQGNVASLARRLQNLFEDAGQTVKPFLPPRTPPWWTTSATRAARIGANELAAKLAAEAIGHGVLPQDIAWLDGFARAGEIVLLLGDRAELALTAYARAVSGGEIRSHALDPSAIGLDDLWRVPSSGKPTAFALAWHRARFSVDSTVLLCLRDFDAAPFRLWLASAQAALQSAERPRNLLVVATASAVSGEEEDFPGAERLRRHLVALRPGAHPRSGKADVVLDEPMPDPSLFVPSSDDRKELSPTAILAISNRGKESNVVRRAVRLAMVIGAGASEGSEPLAQAWAGYLQDGRAEGLPPALSNGHDDLKTLHLQR